MPARAWTRRVGHRLRREPLLLGFGVATLVLGLADPRPWPAWRAWMNLPTLLGLTALFLSIEAINVSGLAQRAADRLVGRCANARVLALALVLGAAVASTVLTNDVALLLVVPLTVALGRVSSLPVLRLVIFEAFAVNAGSTLSPIGNPQNLLLWQHSGLSAADFVARMAPAAAAMFALLLPAVVLGFPAGGLDRGGGAPTPVRIRLGVGAVTCLVAVVLLLQWHRPGAAAGLAALFCLLAAPEVPRRLDWALLATFLVMFLALGHAAALPALQPLWRADWLRQPAGLYIAAIALSQAISNVPAAVLLVHGGADPMRLAVAVNVGGFGLALGSLANLIALRLVRTEGGLAAFHRWSVPFLLACAPLVWWVGTWAG